MSKNGMIWMLVTNDTYEMPLACEPTAEALAKVCRMTKRELLQMRRKQGMSVKVKKIKRGKEVRNE